MQYQTMNYQGFLKKLKSSANYMFSCLMLSYLNEVRQQLLNVILKVRKCLLTLIQSYHPNQRVVDSSLMKVLLFEDERDFQRFLESCGFMPEATNPKRFVKNPDVTEEEVR